jgi:hypothetical protein
MLSSVLTGSYHNYFRIYDVNSDNDVVLQADKSAFKAKKIGGARGKVPGKKEGLQTEGIDFGKKIVRSPLDWCLTIQLHASWHPRENTIAVSASHAVETLAHVHRSLQPTICMLRLGCSADSAGSCTPRCRNPPRPDRRPARYPRDPNSSLLAFVSFSRNPNPRIQCLLRRPHRYPFASFLRASTRTLGSSARDAFGPWQATGSRKIVCRRARYPFPTRELTGGCVFSKRE